jgi:energy-coupling factor transporter ATP-binding protein EcfA2
MNKVLINLENCFGIKKLSYEFDFTNSKVCAVYARNGLMKTSFSKTFKKIQENKQDDIKDEIYNLTGVANAKIDMKEMISDDVFVIKSYESSYESNNITSLLLNNEIKESIISVLKLKDNLLKQLEKYSGLKVSKISAGKKVFELEPTIVKDFGFNEDSFLLNIDKFDTSKVITDFRYVQYASIFDEGVLKKITTADFQNKIDEYLIRSDEIYADFGFLDKGKFTLPKLKDTEKALSKDNFFVKDNKIVLNGNVEIKDGTMLKYKIKEIEDKLKETPEIKEIEKLLSDVKGMNLKEVIENNPDIVRYLKIRELDNLKICLWVSYILAEQKNFDFLKIQYHRLEKEIEGVSLDDTPWREALNIFEERFTVPYKMNITNLKSSIIGESIPRVEFTFCRDGNSVSLNRTELEDIDVLSQGEKRALYLLNIIFDIEERKKQNRETLFIIDDIADSFDYKNKYAIIEYLYDMANESNFYLIILSHNFDFYRTVSSRLDLKRENRLCAETCINEIALTEEKYQKQPFEYWKKNLDIKNILALIPFARNLIEYGEDKNVGGLVGINEDYLLLTNLLHKKDKTNYITFNNLKNVYRTYLGVDAFDRTIVLTDPVCCEIYNVADRIRNTDVNLENKIILAIAIRHKAEMFMISEIEKYSGNINWTENKKPKQGNNIDFINYVKSTNNQTRELFSGFKQFGAIDKIKTLEKVNIMTPENIHLNSFMYEPLIDMDILELIKLYQDVKLI